MTARDFTPAELQAIDLYCAGDRDFFLTYRAACVAAFRDDLALADGAVAEADAPTLRRVAHSIKGVLVSIGQPRLAEQAAALEAMAEAADLRAATRAWDRLRSALCAAFNELS